MAMGMVLTSANPAYTPIELNMQLQHSNAKILFTNSALMDTARKASNNSNVELLISIDESSVNDSGVVHLADILENGDQNFTKELVIDAHNDVAILSYTSGTTGLPKGVMLTHQNLVSNTLQVIDSIDWNMPTNMLGVLPMHHIYALTGVVLAQLYRGATVHVLPNFEPKTFLSAIEDYKVRTNIKKSLCYIKFETKERNKGRFENYNNGIIRLILYYILINSLLLFKVLIEMSLHMYYACFIYYFYRKGAYWKRQLW